MISSFCFLLVDVIPESLEIFFVFFVTQWRKIFSSTEVWNPTIFSVPTQSETLVIPVF